MPYKDPEKRKEADRQRKRALRQAAAKADPSRKAPLVAPVPLDFKLRSAQGILDTLEQQARVLATDTQAGGVEKARCIGYLCSVALRAIETGGLEVRLAEVEAILAQKGLRVA